MNTSNLKNNHTEISQDSVAKPPISPVGLRTHGSIDNIERRAQNHTVFHVDDSSFISSLPRTTHWSIAWSDLMMTMFILFLSMFVYQTANEEFLGKKRPEVVGGDTTEALESMDASGSAFPIAPIYPGLPLMTAGTIKKVVPVHPDSVSSIPGPAEGDQGEQTTENQADTGFETSASKRIAEEQIALLLPENNAALPSPKISIPLQPQEDLLEPLPLPLPLPPTDPEPLQHNGFQEMFVLSQNTLNDNNLDKYAAIEIIPDKTMRIILTSDLLFALGKSKMSNTAQDALRKIARIIRLTPYMINVVGHTDNIPMRSDRFQSNWELSISRATTVARFFIDEIGMDPSQFVVSGYSSYRPIKPNTTAENRARNRRVEIIISKRLPNPTPATEKNLQ